MKKKKIETTLEWIEEVRSECKKLLQIDIGKVLKNYNKGNTEGNYALLEEIRDNERDDALLSLIQEMLKEEGAKD